MAAKNSTTQFSFNSRTVQYHSGNAYWLSSCSLNIYKGKSSNKKLVNGWGLDRFEFISKGTTQCFVASNDRIIIVCFRGTEVTEVEDIAADLEFTQTRAYGGRVHEGFYEAYNLVKEKLVAAVKQQRDNNQTIWITGHSLGGGLSVICAIDLIRRGLRANGVYTFGQPRVGNLTFCSAYNRKLKSRHFRIVHKDDIVPDIPLRQIGAGKVKIRYSHVGRIIYSTPKHVLVLKYVSSNNPINKAVSAANAGSAHGIVNYCETMRRNINFNPFTASVKKIVEQPVYSLNDLEKDTKDLLKKGGSKVEKELKKAGNTLKDTGKKIKNFGKKFGF